jgi:hypothetical protein
VAAPVASSSAAGNYAFKLPDVGEGTADNWARHAPQRIIQRHYVSRLDLSRSPLGLDR